MNLFEDNTILIVPFNQKYDYLKLLNEQKKLLNVKILTFSEIKKKIFFDYDINTIYNLMKKFDLSYNNADKYIKSLYFLNDNERLNKMYEYLVLNNLISKDKFFTDNVKNKKFIIKGFYAFLNDEKYIIEKLKQFSTVHIEKYNPKHKHNILKFKTINEEINYVAEDIIKNNYNLDDVFIANLNEDYEEYVRRIFSFYNINLNINNRISLYNTGAIKKYLKTKNLLDIKNIEIRNHVISIINKISLIKEDKYKNDILENLIKNTYIKTSVHDNSVNIIDLKDDFVSKDMKVYLIAFANEYIPRVYKDEDIISDVNKVSFDNTSINKNKVEKSFLLNKLNDHDNITITFSDENNNISSLSENMDITEKEFHYSSSSNLTNLYNLSIDLDQYIKYNNTKKSLNRLYYNYPDNKYNNYNNSYNKINSLDVSNLRLSYSKLNSFYECKFKYYISNILKLNIFENNFNTYLGNYIHHVLFSIDHEDFELEKTTSDYLNENYFKLTKENEFYLNLYKDSLKEIIKKIKEFEAKTRYSNIYREKEIKLISNEKLNISFTGIIDKIMMHDDGALIIDYKNSSNLSHYLNLQIAHHGLGMQLPIYTFLAKKFNNSLDTHGIYLQSINRVKLNENIDTNLKLQGYTIDDYHLIDNINSLFLRNVSFKSDGELTANSKVLNKSTFDKLSILANNKINEAIQDIRNADFLINPKIIDNNNYSCEYCKYKDICFTRDKDKVYLEKDKNLDYLKEI